jgi:multicomponent Na+:H+ antiporter subunit G
VTTRAVLVIAFFFLTAPVGAHMIAQAAYAVGVPLWEGTITDELRDHRRAAGQTAPDSPPQSPLPPAEGSQTP